MKFSKISAVLFLAAAMAVAGCEVGPNFRQPKMAMPTHWSGTSADLGPTGSGPAANSAPSGHTTMVTSAPANLATWWKSFQDPVLNSLVGRALAQNLSLQQAQQQIVASREVRNASAATLGPFVSAGGSYQRSRGSKNLGSGGGGGPSESNLYQAGFDATWELDIFGQVRRGVEAANANLKAAVDSRRELMVTLLGELGNDYMTLRGIQRQIVVTRDNLKSQIKTVALLKAQIGGGIATQLALTSAQAQAQTTRSQIPELRIQERQLIYAISLLLSEPPDTLVKELSVKRPIPQVPSIVPVGLPGDLLLRRPDVRQAEQEYAAATANVGVAEANLFPQFTINGNIGYSASDAAKWFDASSLGYGIGPSVSWSILNWGQVGATINQQKALRVESLLNYHQVVLQALSDADSALAAYTRELVHEQDLTLAVKENQQAVNLSLRLYHDGLTNYLNVLQAQQSLYLSQETLVQSQTAVSADLVALYKALGGGWPAAAAVKAKAKS